SVYQDQVYVPLLIKYPGQNQAGRVDALASQVDLMPTMLEAAGVAAPPGLQGTSLLHARTAPDREVISEVHRFARKGRLAGTRLALLSGWHKLIYSTEGPSELYDLSADPSETHDLFGSDVPLAARLREDLNGWSGRTLPRYLDSKAPDAKTVERLKSLG